VLYKDEKYGVWKLRVSDDGNTLVAATRKIMLFDISDINNTGTMVKGPNVSDTDSEHVKSLNVKDGYVVTSRAGCVRSKVWSMDGQRQKLLKGKKAIAQSDFLCDDKWCVTLQQELIANEAPRAPVMKLHQYKIKTPELISSPEPDVMDNDACLDDVKVDID